MARHHQHRHRHCHSPAFAWALSSFLAKRKKLVLFCNRTLHEVRTPARPPLFSPPTHLEHLVLFISSLAEEGFFFCPIFHFILSHDAADCCSLPSFHFAVILLMSFCLFGLISVSCSCLSVCCCCCCYVFCVLLLCLCDLFIAIRICKLHLRSPFPWHLFHFSYVLPETGIEAIDHGGKEELMLHGQWMHD